MLGLHIFGYTTYRRHLGKTKQNEVLLSFALGLHLFGYAIYRRHLGKTKQNEVLLSFALGLHYIRRTKDIYMV